MAKKTKNKALWHPALWPTWILYGFVFLLAQLPFANKIKVGEALGRLAYKHLRSRTKVTRKNIQACFPEMTPADQETLVVKAFESVGRGLMESIHCWFCDVSPALSRTHILGEEHVEAARKRGKGILLIGGHYCIFDLALPLIACQLPKPGYMYRPNDNPVIDRMIERGRRRHYGIQAFSKWQIKELIQFLSEGGMVWYACDQDFGHRSKYFVPFFGVPAGCIDMPSKVAEGSGATVICVGHLRRPDGSYEIEFSPIMEGFGQNPEADAHAWNAFLESKIRQYPDQYLWLHRRFKTQPEGSPGVY